LSICRIFTLRNVFVCLFFFLSFCVFNVYGDGRSKRRDAVLQMTTSVFQWGVPFLFVVIVFFCLFQFYKLLEEGQYLIDNSLPNKEGYPNIARILKAFTGISIVHEMISFLG